jgi:hypothetical protein
MNELQKTQANVPMIPTDIEQVLVQGDIGRMQAPQRVEYYNALCASLGLNPLTQPFEYLTLNGKVKLYAKKDCTDQLRRIYGVSVTLSNRTVMEGLCIISAMATLPGGRTDESTGAVSISGLKGESLANAIMKAETKAKRRVTLSVCGLGMLDETEIDSIPGAIRESDGSREQQKAVADAKLATLKAGVEPDKPWRTKKQFLEIFEQLRQKVGDEIYLKALESCAGVAAASEITDSAAALSAYHWLTGEVTRLEREAEAVEAEQEAV